MNMMSRICGFAWLDDIQLLSQGVLTFVSSYFDNYGCMLSSFQWTVNLYKQHIDYSQIYPNSISEILSLEDLIKWLLKCEGCTHVCEVLYVLVRERPIYVHIWMSDLYICNASFWATDYTSLDNRIICVPLSKPPLYSNKEISLLIIVVLQENEHLKKFQVTWELHNKHLFESLVFSEPILHSSLPALVAQLKYVLLVHCWLGCVVCVYSACYVTLVSSLRFCDPGRARRPTTRTARTCTRRC